MGLNSYTTRRLLKSWRAGHSVQHVYHVQSWHGGELELGSAVGHTFWVPAMGTTISLRAAWNGSLTSKLARASLKRLTGPALSKLMADRKQLVRVWRIVSYAPAGVDSPPLALHCLAPSNSLIRRALQAWPAQVSTIDHLSFTTALTFPLQQVEEAEVDGEEEEEVEEEEEEEEDLQAAAPEVEQPQLVSILLKDAPTCILSVIAVVHLCKVLKKLQTGASVPAEGSSGSSGTCNGASRAACLQGSAPSAALAGPPLAGNEQQGKASKLNVEMGMKCAPKTIGARNDCQLSCKISVTQGARNHVKGFRVCCSLLRSRKMQHSTNSATVLFARSAPLCLSPGLRKEYSASCSVCTFDVKFKHWVLLGNIQDINPIGTTILSTGQPIVEAV
eukprot:1158529-Pelagomonas_calceolata.AAC.14